MTLRLGVWCSIVLLHESAVTTAICTHETGRRALAHRPVMRTALVLAEVLALLNCGITIAARMPRMITTIRISIRVKPLFLRIEFMVLCLLKSRSNPLLRNRGDAARGTCHSREKQLTF